MSHPSLNPVTPRRGFLATLAAGFAGVGLSAIPFKVNAAPNSAADEWFAKVKGKHRQVFDATNAHKGFPLAWTKIFLSTNNDTGTPDAELSAVVVLRHDAIGVALEDRLWEKYKFGELFKIDDPETKKPATKNVYRDPKPGVFPLPGVGIVPLQARGVMFCVCEMAITFYTMEVAKEMKLDAAELKKEWLAGVLPGIQGVPSGVWAVNRAQEHGCSYCFAGELG